jgi:hypothetical protein
LRFDPPQAFAYLRIAAIYERLLAFLGSLDFP